MTRDEEFVYAMKEFAVAGMVGFSFGLWQHSIAAGILAAVVFIRFGGKIL